MVMAAVFFFFFWKRAIGYQPITVNVCFKYPTLSEKSLFPILSCGIRGRER